MKEGWRKTRKEKRKKITVASTFRNSEFNNNSSPWTMIHLVLCLFLDLFIFQIFISRYPIREEPNFVTHSLQIYCTRLIGLVSQSYWAWALNRDPTLMLIQT